MSKYAFISGSSKGIGKYIALELANNGYYVYINGRNSKDVYNTVAQIGDRAIPIVCDMTSEDDVKKLISEIFKTNNIDLVVSNVGSGKSISGYNVEISEYKRVFDLNFFSTVILCSEVLKYMKEDSSIIIISSIAGCESINAPLAYSSAKSALLSYAKNLSNLVSKRNIRVNSISPGNVMFEGSSWEDKIKNDKQKVLDYIELNVPLNSFVQPHDIAKAVLFLDTIKSITGSNIVIDCGQTKKIF